MNQREDGEACSILKDLVGDFVIRENLLQFKLPSGKNLDGNKLFEVLAGVFPGQVATRVSSVSGGPGLPTEYIYTFSSLNR